MASNSLINPNAFGSGPNSMAAVSIAFLTLSWISVLLRVWVRSKLIRAFGWDDGTMVLTLLLFTVQAGALIGLAKIETGDTIRQISGPDLPADLPILSRLAQIVILLIALYLWVTVALKISLAIFFLRIVSIQWQRRVIYTTTALYSLYGVCFSFIAIFQCGAPKHFLENTAAGNCVSNDVLQPLNYVAAALNALIDWIFVFFPLYVIWRSNMPRRQKVSACVLLGFGAVGSIGSLIRVAYIPGLIIGPNFYGRAIDIAIWSLVEPGIGIIAASLATLRPLFKALREGTRDSSGVSIKLRRGSGSRNRHNARQRHPTTDVHAAQQYIQDHDLEQHPGGEGGDFALEKLTFQMDGRQFSVAPQQVELLGTSPEERAVLCNGRVVYTRQASGHSLGGCPCNLTQDKVMDRS